MNKIYTKTGDKGETSMLGGKRVSKSCLEMDVIGEVDELNTVLGMLVEEIEDNTESTEGKELTEVKKKLINIQHKLFTIGSQLAALQTDLVETPEISEKDVEMLENWIDAMDKDLPKLTNFIIPGGSEESCLSFYARAICRRAERRLIELSEKHDIPEPVKQYVNRLSDLLFTLARWLNVGQEAEEVKWKK